MSNISNFQQRVMACWLGKAVGGTLGLPFEGQDGPFDLTFYEPVPTVMMPNDDLDLQVLMACVLDQMPKPRVDRHIFGKAWLDHVNFCWDEYGVCIRNLRNGIHPPLTGSYDNWFTRGMGAAIRTELWACLAPGNPALAVAYAYEDACVDHAGEGIWAALFFAAIESAAFVESDRDALLDIGLSYIPGISQVSRAVRDTREWAGTQRWQQVRRNILTRYGNDNFTDVVMNVAFTVLGWIAGNGDFSRAICIANNCGKDTDCTAATVGALMGIIDPNCIVQRWLAPIGRDLVLSPPIVNVKTPPTLDAFTDLVVRLRERLAGEAPKVPDIPQDLSGHRIPVEIAYCNDMPASDTAPALTAPAQVHLAGTFAVWPRSAFEKPVMLLRYRFSLDSDAAVRILFNTPTASRVWVDGAFQFGATQSIMVPAFHRPPENQFGDLKLDAGMHELIAAVQMPADAPSTEWVVGIADARTHQWVTSNLTWHEAQAENKSPG